jgi:hypothetical protein
MQFHGQSVSGAVLKVTFEGDIPSCKPQADLRTSWDLSFSFFAEYFVSTMGFEIEWIERN